MDGVDNPAATALRLLTTDYRLLVTYDEGDIVVGVAAIGGVGDDTARVELQGVRVHAQAQRSVLRQGRVHGRVVRVRQHSPPRQRSDARHTLVAPV